MTVRYVRPVSNSAYAARRIGLAALVLFVLALAAHRFGPLRTPDFLALVLLSAAIAAAAVPLALIGLGRLWQKGADGGVASAKALVYAGVPLSVVGAGVALYLSHPPIYDVTTDTEDPPLFLSVPNHEQQWMARPSAATVADRRAQVNAYPGLTGRRYEGALDRVYEGVKAAALSARIDIRLREGIELVEVETAPDPSQADDPPPEDDALALDSIPIPMPRPDGAAPVPMFSAATDVVLQGETETLALGLPFDLVIRLREDAETTSVDIRVVSRYGPHDLGMSAAVADDFLKRLDAELLGIAGG